MKLPIVSRKKYEMLKGTNKTLNEARLELSKSYQKSQLEVQELNNINRELSNELVLRNEDILKYKKEVANLKRLLTKNHIEYKKVKEKK